MKLVVFGLTVTSSWGNGHATTYRSLLRALARRGHTILFVERDVEWYRSNRDMPDPEFFEVVLYESWAESKARLLALTRDADAVVVGSYFPDAIRASEALFELGTVPVLFYDIDTPITLAGLRARGSTEYLSAAAIPGYAVYLSFTGGPALEELEGSFGARRACAFYCSVDPELYRPSPPDARFAADLSYLGTYSPDRQVKLEELLGRTALLLPERAFLVAGPQYPPNVPFASNVRRMTHIHPPDHPAFYSSGRWTLNLTRDDMASAGYSPSVRLFEASACGAAILSDAWPGIEQFLTPGEEILLPRSAEEVRDLLLHLPESDRVRFGERARERILAQHTASHRAEQFERIVSEM